MNPIHATLAAVAALAAAGAAQKRGSRNATNSDAFRRWFGDSQVVDEQGEPLVMYHGTMRDFDAFDPDKSFTGLGASFFTPDPAFTDDYTYSGASLGKGGSIMPVYLKVENPYDATNPAHREIAKAKIREAYPDGLYVGQSFLEGEALVDYIVRDRTGYRAVEDPRLMVALRESGFDGFYVTERGVRNIGVFSPTQIKSATGNRGTFSPTDPRISYNRRAP